MINYTYLPIFGTGSIFIANWIITMFKNSFFIVLVTVLEKMNRDKNKKFLVNLERQTRHNF